MLYHQMLREKEVLDQREKNILERLQTYPAGKLIYSQNGKHKKWYISCDGQKIYIPSNEKNTAVSMAEKKYYEVMLQDIVQEKRAIQSYLDLCNRVASSSAATMTNSSPRRADITSCIPVMPSLKAKRIYDLIVNSARIREDMIRALFLWICDVCVWRSRTRAQPPPQACAVSMKK